MVKFFSMHLGSFRGKLSKGKSSMYSEPVGVSQEGEWSPCGPSTTRGHLKDFRPIGAALLWSSKGQTFCMTHCVGVGST